MNGPRRALTEREIDDAIRRNRTSYDCAECTDEWDDDDEAAELAELAAEAKAPLRGAGKVLAGILLAATAARRMLIAAALERAP
jgi:hypothetical protein